MSDIYKQALKDFRGLGNNMPFMSNAAWSYFEPTQEISQENETSSKLDLQNESDENIAKEPNTVTEKVKVLDSLYEFAKKNLEELGGDTLEQNGAQIKKTAPQAISKLEAFSDKSFEDVFSQILTHNLELYISNTPQAPIKVLFVSDFYLDSEIKDSFLEIFFEAEVASLFGRMISAMNLNSSNFFMTALGKETNAEAYKDQVLKTIIYQKPEMIITLGANVTNSLLGIKERLQSTHGKLFDLDLGENGSFKLMPLFSPKLLITAPNMKKTAWKDMQKVMQLIDLIK